MTLNFYRIRHMLLFVLLLPASASCAAANPVLVKESNLSDKYGLQCISQAIATAKERFGNDFKYDWYVRLGMIYRRGELAEVDVHIGPYDGSFGGSVKAKFKCKDRLFVEIQYER